MSTSTSNNNIMSTTRTTRTTRKPKIISTSSSTATRPSSSVQCKSYTDSYRNCLKDCRDSGRSKTSSKTCKPLAIKLDNCREEWRKKYDPPPLLPPSPPSQPSSQLPSPSSQPSLPHNTNNKDDEVGAGFDGTRILPNPICRPLSCNVQSCIKWHQGNQTKCKKEIQLLMDCMKNPNTKDIVVKPTDGDKIWTV
jgi:hypothetical protein